MPLNLVSGALGALFVQISWTSSAMGATTVKVGDFGGHPDVF